MSFFPDRVLNTSLILDGVFFSLLFVVVLCAATMTSKSFVETYMSWIALLKWPEKSWLFRWNRLIFECFGCAKSHKVGIECSMLTDSKFKGLASIKNFPIKFCIFFSFQILFSFVRIFLVSNSIQRSKWVSCFLIVESRYSLHERCQCF